MTDTNFVDELKEIKTVLFDLRDRVVRIEAKLPPDGFQCPIHSLKLNQHDKAIEELQSESKSNVAFKTKTAVYFAIIFFVVQTLVTIGITYFAHGQQPQNHNKPVAVQQTNHFVAK